MDIKEQPSTIVNYKNSKGKVDIYIAKPMKIKPFSMLKIYGKIHIRSCKSVKEKNEKDINNYLEAVPSINHYVF